MCSKIILTDEPGLLRYPLQSFISFNSNQNIRMSLQSALLGFLISKLLRARISPQENAVLQTTATATGTVRSAKEYNFERH